MNITERTLLDLLHQEAQVDCAQWVERATSGNMGRFVGMPAAVGQTSEIYIRLGINGRLTAEDAGLLRQALLRHLGPVNTTDFVLEFCHEKHYRRAV